MLEERGHKFVRYADDRNIYVKSRRAAERVMEGCVKFLEGKLKLKVNRKKSTVGSPLKLKFLGFSLYLNQLDFPRYLNGSRCCTSG
jgi:retron-type reverse transcriptase